MRNKDRTATMIWAMVIGGACLNLAWVTFLIWAIYRVVAHFT